MIEATTKTSSMVYFLNICFIGYFCIHKNALNNEKEYKQYSGQSDNMMTLCILMIMTIISCYENWMTEPWERLNTSFALNNRTMISTTTKIEKLSIVM